MHANSFTCPDIILADVLKLVDDERYEYGTRGYYISQMQQCLEELSFDTFFDERELDFDFPSKTLGLAMPPGVFNIRNVYVFEGEKCVEGRSEKVWWKRNYTTKGQGYIANDTGRNKSDPFYFPNQFRRHFAFQNGANIDGAFVGEVPGHNNHYFYNIQNGIIMFSEICRRFPRVKLIINGTGCDIGELPIIPLFFRQTVKDYVCEVALRERMAKDPKWKTLWSVYDRNLNKHGDFGDYKGSWYKAEKRVKNMDTTERNDLKEYISRGNW